MNVRTITQADITRKRIAELHKIGEAAQKRASATNEMIAGLAHCGTAHKAYPKKYDHTARLHELQMQRRDAVQDYYEAREEVERLALLPPQS